mgnify:FL=1
MMKTLEKSIFQGYKTIYNHACEKIKQVFDLEKAKAVGKKSSGRFGEAFGTKRQTKRKKDRFLFPRSILTNQFIKIMQLYKYDEDSISFKKVSYVKYLTLWTIFTMGVLLYGIVKPPKVEVVEKLTPMEKYIVINEATKFSEEKLIEEIKRLNFNFPYLVYCQSYVETGAWTSRIYRENNNLFGMKQAQVRANLAVGTQYEHAYYNNWKESLYDYAFYYSEYLSDIKDEDQYIDYVNQRYAEHPEYDLMIREVLPKAKEIFGTN